MNLKEEYPDTFELGRLSLEKMDEFLPKLEELKDTRFESQFEDFRSKFDDDKRTAFIVRLLELGGTPGLPDDLIISSMFCLIDDVFLLTLKMVMDEDIRI